MGDSPDAGEPAPSFRMPSTDGAITLEDMLSRGRPLVLAFYFEDGTPSCETELGMLRDSWEVMDQAGVNVVAVSADTLESHAGFTKRIGGFPFALASDGSLEAARAYGVVDDGDPRRSRRAVFVIDSDGTIMLALPRFQPNNLSQVEAIFRALGVEVGE